MMANKETIAEYENALRRAEAAIEEAGRVICPLTGEAASTARYNLQKAIAAVQDEIHGAYAL
jgi:hypothetical protein